MGVSFQKRKTRWTMLGGSNNVGRAEGHPVAPTESFAWNRLKGLAARLGTPFLHGLSQALLAFEKRPHARTSSTGCFIELKGYLDSCRPSVFTACAGISAGSSMNPSRGSVQNAPPENRSLSDHDEGDKAKTDLPCPALGQVGQPSLVEEVE